MLPWKHAKEEAESKMALGVSAECLRGNTRRPLVLVDYSRHDATGLPDLQGISGFLRGHSYKHFGGSPAKIDCSWNHRHPTRPRRRAKTLLLAHRQRTRSCTRPHRNGALGRGARRYRKPGAYPSNPEGQGAISGCSATALGRKDFAFFLISSATGPSPQALPSVPGFVSSLPPSRRVPKPLLASILIRVRPAFRLSIVILQALWGRNLFRNRRGWCQPIGLPARQGARTVLASRNGDDKAVTHEA